MFKMILGLMVLSTGLNSTATAHQNNNADQLNELLSFMDESMDETDIYFNYEKNPNAAPCVPQVVSQDLFVNTFISVVDSTVGEKLFPNGGSESGLKNLIQLETSQFLELFGAGPYLMCEGTGSGYMTSSQYFFFGSNHVQIVFEFGYED